MVALSGKRWFPRKEGTSGCSHSSALFVACCTTELENEDPTLAGKGLGNWVCWLVGDEFIGLGSRGYLLSWEISWAGGLKAVGSVPTPIHPQVLLASVGLPKMQSLKNTSKTSLRLYNSDVI